MKIRRKPNNPVTFSNVLPDQIFEDKSKINYIKNGGLKRHGNTDENKISSIREMNLESVENLDVMDLNVSNFQFVNFNKIDLESLDIINEDSMVKEELFHSVVDDIITDSTDANANNFSEVPRVSPDIMAVSSSSHADSTKTINSSAAIFPIEINSQSSSGLNKRALKRKQKLEQTKAQCPVRTTARHYTKMLDFFEANPGLATGQLPKIIYRKKWRDLTEVLNRQGIGEKTTEKWQKTWSDYKLHLRKKVSGIKRSGKALDVPNQFSDLDKRALTNMGISFCDENSKMAITKRFNPDILESEDSSSHSTFQSVQSTTYSNLPTSTTDGSPTSRRNILNRLRHKKLLYRRRRLRAFRVKTREYQKKSLKELTQLRLTVNVGLSRIGDILERLAKNSEANSTVAVNLAEAAAQIAATASNLAEMFSGCGKNEYTRF